MKKLQTRQKSTHFNQNTFTIAASSRPSSQYQNQDSTMKIKKNTEIIFSTNANAVSVDNITASAGVVWFATQTPPLRGFHCTLWVFITAEMHSANIRNVINDASSLTTLLNSLSGQTLSKNVHPKAHDTWKSSTSVSLVYFLLLKHVLLAQYRGFFQKHLGN